MESLIMASEDGAMESLIIAPEDGAMESLIMASEDGAMESLIIASEDGAMEPSILSSIFSSESLHATRPVAAMTMALTLAIARLIDIVSPSLFRFAGAVFLARH